MTLLRAPIDAITARLPGRLRARLLSIWSASSLRRIIRKRRAKKRLAEKAAAVLKHGRFDVAELSQVLGEHGVAAGDAIFVQCSFNDLHTFASTPLQLIDALQKLVGSSGTVLMPAYTAVNVGEQKTFDPTVASTYTGIVSEMFRRSSGVMRSLHPRHSICGRGPLASVVLSGHETCIRADGPDSPFDRLRNIDTAKILTLGLPVGHVSFLHWLEDIEPEKLPFPVHLSEPQVWRTNMPGGAVRDVQDWLIRPDIPSRLSLSRLFQKVSKDAYTHFEHKGVQIGIYSMPALALELLSLRDRGIIHYH